MTTQEQIINAAMDLAAAVGQGSLAPADVEAEAIAKCRELFGTVFGPGDELWPLHIDVFRQVLHIAAGGDVDGLSAAELSEWAALARLRAGEKAAQPVSWIEAALAAGADDDREDDDGDQG